MILKKFKLIILYIILRQNLGNVNGSKCSYADTINITNSYVFENGSYLYQNETLTPDLVDTYDYEILYSGKKHPVPQHKRACICHIKRCINFCSVNISLHYNKISIANSDLSIIFDVNVMLENSDVIELNLVEDFEHNILNGFCSDSYPLSMETGDDNYAWTLFENGSLLRHKDNRLMDRSEYCFEFYIDEEGYPLVNPMNCPLKRHDLSLIEKINYWFQVVSIFFCILTFLGYFWMPGFFNLAGKCFTTYLINLTSCFAIFSYINLTQITLDDIPCLIFGYLNQFLQLSQYTWLGIISYYIWKTCKDNNYVSSYYKYAIIGYSLPLVMTAISYLAQNLEINEDLKPGISNSRCGLNVHRWIAALYLYGYFFIVLIFCLVYFILTSKQIDEIHKAVDIYRVSYRNSQGFKGKFMHYIVYFRLFSLMGLSWMLEVLTFLLQMWNCPTASSVIDCINSLQGINIFIIFLTRKEVRAHIKQYFRVNQSEDDGISNVSLQLLRNKKCCRD